MSELRPIEQAPSEVRTDEPGVTQLVGLTGAGLAVLGVIVVVANHTSTRVVSPGVGYLLAAVGLVAMFYHALRDGSVEVRRAYTYFSFALVAAALLVAVVPGPLFADNVEKHAGYHFIPWSPLLGMLALVFLVTALRHETDESFQLIGLGVLLTVGAALCVGSVALAIFKPDSIVGPGALLGLLGLGFVAAFLSRVDSADGLGYLVASLLGVLGGAALLYAFGRAVFPTMIFEGPPALRNAYQALDPWKVLGRLFLVALCLGGGAWAGLNKALPVWLRAGLGLIGLAFAGVFVVSAAATVAVEPPRPYLVPDGLLLGGLGVVYLVVSLGIVSDSPLIAMTRRELASYFYSPIAYIVLLGMAAIEFIGYWLFLGAILEIGRGGIMQPVQEPILRDFLPATFLGPIVVIFLVPALTMRLFSEERRSGTMEVLITAPVGEWTIVLSKFLGSWLFYMLTWVPMGLYLFALRMEGGQPFDYRPLLGLYLAIGACGAGFIAMGLFFSSLTKNQIIAAVLTFMGMLFLFVLNWSRFFGDIGVSFLRELMNALSLLSYWQTWRQAAGGQLPVRDLVLHGSLAVFWLYLTVKSLETRKWG